MLIQGPAPDLGDIVNWWLPGKGRSERFVEVGTGRVLIPQYVDHILSQIVSTNKTHGGEEKY